MPLNVYAATGKEIIPKNNTADIPNTLKGSASVMGECKSVSGGQQIRELTLQWMNGKVSLKNTMPKVKTVSVGDVGLKSIKIKSCPSIETLEIGTCAKKVKISLGDIYACKKLKKLKAPKAIIDKLDRSKLSKTVKIQTAS